MKLKKATALLCVGGMLLTPVTAMAAETPNEDLEGSLTIWEHNYSFENALKAVIEGFQKKYPNVDVEYEIKDSEYYSVLATAIQSGDAPDLFYTDGNSTASMEDYVENGALMDLTDTVDWSSFGEWNMGRSNIGDKLYSVPWLNMDTRTVYYNIDMFEENGWKVPTKFSEFEELLATIKEAGVTPISACGTGAYDLLFMYEPIMAAMDVEYTKGLSDYSVKATDAPARDAMKKMVEWADKGYYGDNWLGVADSNAMLLAFTSGEAAMMISGSWDATAIADNNPELNYGAFAIPSEDGVTGLVGTPSTGFSVSATTESPDAALAFANYCASLEAQTIWVQTMGSVSSVPEIEASTEISKEISESGGGNVYTSWQSVLATHSVDGTAVPTWEEDFPKVFSGDITVDELMDEISAVME